MFWVYDKLTLHDRAHVIVLLFCLRGLNLTLRQDNWTVLDTRLKELLVLRRGEDVRAAVRKFLLMITVLYSTCDVLYRNLI